MDDDIQTPAEPVIPDAGGNPADTGDNLETQAGDSPPQDSDTPDSPSTPKEGEDVEGEDKPEEAKRPTPEGLKKRFAELTGAKREAQAEATGLRDEVETLKAKLAELEGGKPPVPAAPADAVGAKPRFEDFESVEEYEAANTEWLTKTVQARVKQEQDAEFRQAQAQRTEAERVQKFEARKFEVFESGVTKYGDAFEAVFKTPEQGGIPVSQVMADAILDEASAPDVLQYLALKPEEAKRIFGLSPLQQVKEITKIQIKVETEAKKPNITKAPPPPNPVGSRSTVSKDPKSMSMEEYAKYRDEQDRKARK